MPEGMVSRNRSVYPLLLLACVLLLCGVIQARGAFAQGDSAGLQVTTEERLQTEAWWPTKMTFPLSAFAGSAACAQCHHEETGIATSMALAARPAADAAFLPVGTAAHYDPSPLVRYLLANSAGSLNLSVSGAHASAQPMDWVLGAGVLGRTLMYQQAGRWYQSAVTFYTEGHALDVTTGLTPDPHTSGSRLGDAMPAEDAARCFACHTVHASTPAGLNPQHAEAGVGCEACHGPALRHVQAAAAPGVTSAPGVASAVARSGVFDPAKLSPADSIDFCGSCHRTFADAQLVLGQTTSSAAVRFQPYRLEESRCWRAGEDERLTCVACHDPHQPLVRTAASYDRKCVTCHRAVASVPVHTAEVARVCPKATSGCTTCHMPKVRVSSMHGEFTDHDIRIVRAGGSMPS